MTYPDKDIIFDDDNPELTDSELASARPFAEVLPELAASIRRARGKQKAQIKSRVMLRLDAEILNAFKATGKGWQTRINDALKAVVPR